MGTTRDSGHFPGSGYAVGFLALGPVHYHISSSSVSSTQVPVEVFGFTLSLTFDNERLQLRYLTLSGGSMGIYDPTEIRNRGTLSKFQKEAFIKFGYHLVIFFVTLYWYVHRSTGTI